jgi:hypothetical protein
MTNTTEKIFIGIDDKVIELKGEAKEAFLLDRKNEAENVKNRKAEAEAKTVQRQLILDKLGLTADEAQLLLG